MIPTQQRTYSPNSPDKIHYAVEVQGACIKIKGTTSVAGQTVGGVRNNIGGFSPASRRRLAGWFARLREEAISQSWFCTLTYPDEALPTGESLKRDIDTLFKRVQRAYPGFCVIWKEELKRRKSGEYEGQLVPHLHLCVVAHPNTTLVQFGEWLRQAWHEIVNSKLDKHHREGVHYQAAYGNTRAISFYVSKYVAKGDVTKDEATEFGWVGRFWGIAGRKHIPLAEQRNLELSQQEYIHLRRLARRWLTGWKSGRRYADRIAKNSVNYGFELWGIPSDVALKLIDHAKELAAAS